MANANEIITDYSTTDNIDQIGVNTDTNAIYPAVKEHWTWRDIPSDWAYRAIPSEWGKDNMADISAYLLAKTWAYPMETPYCLIEGYIVTILDGTLRTIQYESAHRHTIALTTVNYATESTRVNIQKRAEKLTALLKKWNIQGATYADIFKAYQRFLKTVDSSHQSVARFAKCGKGILKGVLIDKALPDTTMVVPTMKDKMWIAEHNFDNKIGPIIDGINGRLLHGASCDRCKR